MTFGYDLAGRINRIQADGQTIVEQLSYHPFGPVTGWTWGNGTLHTRSLDLDGRISAYPLGGVTHSVSYDPASRITGISGTETQSYGYDALDRLTSVTAPGINQTYSYDPNGNRLIETLGAQTTSYSYTPGSNRLQSRTQGTAENYTYDPAGNLIADGAHIYTYDARGRMVQSTTGALTTSYRYNGLGQRVSKTLPGTNTVSRRFAYDETGHIIGEYDATGAPIEETVYVGDLPIAILSSTNTIHYIHADQITTPRAITDTQGTVRWKWESDPFGVGAPDQDPDGDGLSLAYNLRMPGQYYDQETGLHYNYYRDYDPTLGRYVQGDPIGLAAGGNIYTYVDGNPISFTDPLGLMGFGGMPPGVQGGPGQNTTPSSPGSISQVGGAIGDFLGNYSDMRDANTIGADKYFHCKANCQATRRGNAGEATACTISDTREWIDQNVMGDPAGASAADQMANAFGRAGANSSPISCEIVCSPFRPNGLSPRY